MCNPMLAIGTGLSLAGGVARGMTNSANNRAYANAEKQAYLRSKKAREDEIARQKVFEGEANTNWQNTVQGMGAEDHAASREAAVNDFLQTLEAAPASPAVPEGFMLSGQNNASADVQNEIAARTAKAASEARARIEALAKLTSYDTAALDRNLLMSRNADALTTTNNIRRGSLGVSRDEQNIAQAQVIPGDNMLADILSGAGGSLSGASWRY